ncbi:MAG: 2Fe-2S iron-sulfur cluster-binding protein [Gammaproteobacteria bacterium]|jgi:CDP-4-dehydro-6-deoxyglucose reductase|nr:2Fe-2S iron-sulfur cluster-binding protein [Gammaproteobacteria bacterium]
MSYRVVVLSSGQRFEIQEKETLLDAGLRAGLNLPHNCNNGTCGGCRVRIVSGDVGHIPHDFRFSDGERDAGWVLPCRATAQSDLEIEARLLGSAADVPLQHIGAKVAHIEVLQPDVVEITVRTPRSQALQFLAGQRVELRFDGLPPRELSLASCPCDGMRLHFHLRRDDTDPFSTFAFGRLRRGERVELSGPTGNFLLHDESPRRRIFICWETGFAAVASLVEHAIMLDAERTMHVYWMSAIPQGHYLSNYCRAWVDSLDGFHYHSIDLAPWGEVTIEQTLRDIVRSQSDLADCDVYAALPHGALQLGKTLFEEAGLPPSQWRGEVVPRP